MNLGIADAVSLAECIATNRATHYSALRHSVGSRTINNSERARKLFCSKHPLIRKTLNTSIKLAAHSKMLQRRIVDQLLYA